MLNFKYYLILLIGVFLSLGLGMLIGISLESKDILENQQALIAKEIEEEFIGLRNENRQLRQSIEEIELAKENVQSLCDTLFIATVENRLQGLKISLIETDDANSYSDLISLLKLTGASIESNITVKRNIFSQAYELSEITQAMSRNITSKDELYSYIAQDLVYSIYNGVCTQFINRLSELRFISSLIDIKGGCDVIILGGNGRGKNEGSSNLSFDLQLIKAALDLGIPIIAVENKNIDNTAIPQYKKLGISTVDNIDTIYGKLALVSILNGNIGNFGEKEGSQGLIPEPLFPYIKERDIVGNEAEVDRFESTGQ